MTDDERWLSDKRLCGWTLPPPAPRWMRARPIRHIRAFILWIRVEIHYARIPIGFRTGYDEWVIYAIARGWC